MDDRTAQLLDALDPVAVAILLELIAAPATEAEILSALEGVSQPSANRRLERLRRARIIARETGKRRAPGRLWTLVHTEETGALLQSLLTLSEAIETDDTARRAAAKRKLARARAERVNIPEEGRSSTA